MDLDNKNFLSVKCVFQDHWKQYLQNHSVRDIERTEVEKMLSCKSEERGYFVASKFFNQFFLLSIKLVKIEEEH